MAAIQYRKYVLLGILILLITLVAYLLKPFIRPVLGSLVLAYVCYPLYKKLRAKVKWDWLAALLVSLFLVLLFALPVIIIANTVTGEVTVNYITLKQILATGRIMDEPCVDGGFGCRFVSWAEGLLADPQIKFYLTDLVSRSTDYMLKKAGEFVLQIPMIILNFFIMLFVLFYLLKEGDTIAYRLKRILPLREDQRENIFNRINDVTFAVIYGQLLVSAIQAALGRVGEFVSSPGVKTERLFSAQYRQYQKEPVATVTVDNASDYPLTDVVVSLAVPNLLEVDAQARVEGAVEPRGRRAVSLSVSLSPSLLDLTETTQFEGTVTVSYRAASVPASVTRPVVFEVLHKNAMTWDDDRKLGTFVTSNDAAVRIFGRSVAVFAAKRADGSLPLRLQTAAALFAALGEYGIVYVIDPATPFIEYRESKVAVDYVEYPVETLRSRTGDCDDLVSLYTALLESVGIPAMLVTGPGHIFLAFDSGVPLSELGRVWRLPESVFEYGGSLWVPVEATLVGASFVESWRSAADQYRAWTEQGGIARYPVRDAWKLYPPAAVPDKGWDPLPPAGEALGKRLDRELVELRSMVK